MMLTTRINNVLTTGIKILSRYSVHNFRCGECSASDHKAQELQTILSRYSVHNFRCGECSASDHKAQELQTVSFTLRKLKIVFFYGILFISFEVEVCSASSDRKAQELQTVSSTLRKLKIVMSQHRAAEFLRQAAEALLQNRNSTSSNTTTSSDTNASASSYMNASTSANSTAVTAATRALFAPYRHPITRRRAPAVQAPQSLSYWTHRFCALSSCSQDVAPNREEKHKLQRCGLGEKKITFIKNSDSAAFRLKLEDSFPKLKNCGGYELMRSSPKSRLSLELIEIPAGGYCSDFLSDSSNLFQALCYVRPIQQDIVLHETVEDTDDGLLEVCLCCGVSFPLRQLREHTLTCPADTNEDLPYIKRAKKDPHQSPICQYACKEIKKVYTFQQEKSNGPNEETKTKECPICSKQIDVALLETHASMCGEDGPQDDVQTPALICTEIKVVEKSIEESFNGLLTKSEKEPSCTIDVVRARFLMTAMEQLEDLSSSQWEGSIRVSFIGEDGLDAGGLRREFFTLLFEQSDLLEYGSFRVDAEKLLKRHYCLLGKATAVALIHGHPGPQCFNNVVTNFIIKCKEPENVEDLHIEREDVRTAIHFMENNDISTVDCAMYLDLLSCTGFRKALNNTTKTEAINTLKAHYGFYYAMGPIHQYIEGLQLHGVLSLIRKTANQSTSYNMFGRIEDVTAEEILELYKPCFSSNEEEKRREEMVIYNFRKFLKRVQRGDVSSPWLNCDLQEENDEKMVKITTSHVLRALIGSDRVPRNIGSAVIEFDHKSDNLSTANTCGPTLYFSQTSNIQEYDTFERHILYIVVGAPGFGIA